MEISQNQSTLVWPSAVLKAFFKKPNEKFSIGLKISNPDNSTAMNNATKTGYKISKSGTKRKTIADKKHNLEVWDSIAASKFCGCHSPPLINWMIGVASIDPLAWKNNISKIRPWSSRI